MKRMILTLVLGSLLAAAVPPAATAADPPEVLWNGCTAGSGAGQCALPRGIAADPETGRVYVADQVNRRINELTAWGAFVRAWGWGVEDGSPEFQVCTAASGCQAGIEGAGAGQFGSPQGVAVDPAGNVYVVDRENRRVEKFDPTAGPGEDEVELLLDFGEAGTGDGQFGAWAVGSFIGIGPGGSVYVGDEGRVQVFDADGNYVKSIPLPGETVQSLAVDPASGSFYAVFKKGAGIAFKDETKEEIRKFGPSGEPLCTAMGKNPRALALDPNGDLLVVDTDPVHPQTVFAEAEVRKFNASCQEYPDQWFIVEKSLSPLLTSESTGIATNTVSLDGGIALYYNNSVQNLPFVRAYGAVPDKPLPFDQPPPAAPTLAGQWAVAAGSEEAAVQAEVNPHFWTDTRYRVEYGTAPCSGGGCQSRPPAPGALLGAGAVDRAVKTGKVALPGLQPATTYYYRFVMQSSGGGPVVGPDSTFTTFPEPGALKSCPNDAVRTGAAAELPDCRAYEMVSPIDKAGGDIEALEGIPFFRSSPFATSSYFRSQVNQAAPDGGRVTFSAARAFAGAVSSPWSSQYVAERNPTSGWATHSLNPPLGTLNIYGQRNQEIPFKGFSEDLCSFWFVQDSDRTLVPGAPERVPNLYRGDVCGGGGFGLLTSVPPPGYSYAAEPAGSNYLPEPQGFTANGECTFFRANAALTLDADPAKGRYQLYEACSDGQLRLVSVLPNGEAAPTHASLGTMSGERADFRNGGVRGAISTGGSRVIWSASADGSLSGGGGFHPGILYLRANPLAEPSASGACDEPGKACSLEISSPNSRFIAADPALSRVLYQSADVLFEAEIEEVSGTLVSSSSPIAAGVEGVVGADEDARRVYFTSTADLAPGASAGEPNLYFYEVGAGIDLVGILDGRDTTALSQQVSLDNYRPGRRAARVSPDGLHAAFMSHASLTGYDNVDASSGEPVAEVYLYDAAAEELRCVSCNPSGARPAARFLSLESPIQFWAAAQLPGWATQLHPTRLLGEDGSYLFFESYDALLLSDTNGARDVYQWQEASSQSECDSLGATLYVQERRRLPQPDLLRRKPPGLRIRRCLGRWARRLLHDHREPLSRGSRPDRHLRRAGRRRLRRPLAARLLPGRSLPAARNAA